MNLTKISKVHFLLAVAGSLVLLSSGCAKKIQAAGALGPVPASTVTVTQNNVSVYGEWVATLDGYVNAQIQPQVSGYLVKQNYREGSLVHTGDVLLKLTLVPFRRRLTRPRDNWHKRKRNSALRRSM